MSWAVSVMTWSRHSATGGLDRGPLPSSARRTTRSRNGHPAPDQAGLGEVRLDGVDHDALVAELGALEHGLDRVEQRPVGAPVDAQGLRGGRGLGGLEVGDDVATAEGVDGLLGVADQHHRGGLGEGAPEDLPLHRVGVLELVDEHELPPVLHPPPRRGRGVLEGVGQLAEQVVVAEDAESALAPLHLLEHVGREAHPHGGGRVGRVGEHGAGSTMARGSPTTARASSSASARVHGRRLLAAEAREVEVVDGLGGQLLEVLHEDRGGVGVARHPEAAEHELAELVDGGDGRGVEGDQRGGQAVQAAASSASSGRRRAASRGAGCRGRGRWGRRAAARPRRAGGVSARAAPGWRRG